MEREKKKNPNKQKGNPSRVSRFILPVPPVKESRDLLEEGSCLPTKRFVVPPQDELSDHKASGSSLVKHERPLMSGASCKADTDMRR